MTMYKFRTPIVKEGPSGGHRLFYFAKLQKGITVYGSNGTYQQARYVVDGSLDSYDEVYRGGYEYTVDDATKAALIAGGVGVTEANFTAE